MPIVHQAQNSVADPNVAQSDRGAVAQSNQQDPRRVGGRQNGAVETPGDVIGAGVWAEAGRLVPPSGPKRDVDHREQSIDDRGQPGAVRAPGERSPITMIQRARKAAGEPAACRRQG